MSNSGGERGCREQVKVNPTRGFPPGVVVLSVKIQLSDPHSSVRTRRQVSCCTGPGWKVAWPHMKHRNHCQIKPKVKCQ